MPGAVIDGGALGVAMTTAEWAQSLPSRGVWSNFAPLQPEPKEVAKRGWREVLEPNPRQGVPDAACNDMTPILYRPSGLSLFSSPLWTAV
jgi:hypothetical protein